MPTNDRFANGGSQGTKRRAEDAASNGSSRPRLELEKEQVARHILSLCIVPYCRTARLNALRLLAYLAGVLPAALVLLHTSLVGPAVHLVNVGSSLAT